MLETKEFDVKKVLEGSFKTGKIIVFALLSVQCVFAVWWIVKNIGKVPDFSIAPESFVYSKLAYFLQIVGFPLVYLLQGAAMYLGLKELFPKNRWIAIFTISNPLVLQFVFALVPDVLCLAILLAMLSPLLYGKKIRGRHVIFLFILGMLNASYFFAGIFVLLIIAIKQFLRSNKNTEEEKNIKTQISNYLMLVQVVLVIVLILVSYQAQKNANDNTSVQLGVKARFTIDENIPSNHSLQSVAKGVVMDTLYNVFTPYTYIQAMDQKILTQNGWNYVNFTREEPRMSKYYMELSERNIMIAFIITLITSFMFFIFYGRKRKIDSDKILFSLVCFGISFIFTVTTKRGVDYRNGLFIIPIWYAIILSCFQKIKIFDKEWGIEKSCL